MSRAVLTQNRKEHLQVVLAFGVGALSVSPRIGQVHITVDDLPCSLSARAARPLLWSAGREVRTRCSSHARTLSTTLSSRKRFTS
ncbi:DUF6130 family protein [Gemmatimonas groenlandica]|uniref:DUF6130 family protein n=1 Tax=Gemmatimonas groenlandica TaxID=2732249 RepID=UPI0031B837A3